MSSVTTRLEETICETMDRSRVAGLAIALVKGGELVAAEGYGVTNIDAGGTVQPDTRFSVQSVTKTIVSTAVIQLRDRGLMSLDEPVNQYLAPAKIANEWEAESPVTTRGLLTHTAGFPVGLPVPGNQPIADFVTQFARTTYRPGTDMIYANIGFDIAGVLIERLSGRPVDDYLREAIFERLGMTSSALVNPADGEPRAHGHYRSGVDDVLRTLPLPDWPPHRAPSGGVWSNVFDLAKFLVGHLSPYVGRGSGPDFLSPASITEMHRIHARQGNSESGQGIGFRVTKVNGRATICHGGDGSGFTAFIAAHPDEGVGVAMLMNTGGMQAARSIIGNAALASLAEPERRTFGGATTVLPGLYKSTYWEIELEVREDTLTATSGLVVSEDAEQSRLTPTSPVTVDAEGGIFHGFELTFEGERICGGVYPFTFVRSGNLPGPPPPIDTQADLIGEWSGALMTPLGPIKTTLHITAGALTASTPFGQNIAVENARAKSGRVEGEFTVASPVGEMALFLRLEARGGKLVGTTYGRASFGETPFATELERA
jgi:CubicO group peptidase (beta-lactamase class C family)